MNNFFSSSGYSDLTRNHKKWFFIFLAVYLFGFFLLSLIGDSINDDGYVVMAFIAPLTILVGALGIVWNFYRGSDK